MSAAVRLPNSVVVPVESTVRAVPAPSPTCPIAPSAMSPAPASTVRSWAPAMSPPVSTMSPAPSAVLMAIVCVARSTSVASARSIRSSAVRLSFSVVVAEDSTVRAFTSTRSRVTLPAPASMVRS